MTPPIRCLRFESASGASLMAADEVMLNAAADAGVASLRFYIWAEPTVTLGYFQPAAERVPGLPWARRSTGGAMLVHHHELTYALALPAGPSWQPKEESWICRMHHIIQDVILKHGKRTEAVVCGQERKLGDRLCFLHQTPGDVLAEGHKVVGSAQRKSHGALLQHGGILLRRSEHAPELPGILELLGLEFNPKELANRIAAAFAASTGFEVTWAEWTKQDHAQRERLIAEKYGSDAWNEKR